MKKYRFMKQNTIIAVLKITGKPVVINTCKLFHKLTGSNPPEVIWTFGLIFKLVELTRFSHVSALF